MYFMLPAYIANMAPVIFRKKLNFLAAPLDFGKKFRGRPLLGKNKTFRGLAVGVFFAIAVAFIQYLLKDSAVFYYLALAGLDYSSWFWIGLLMGAGAITGDAVKSFFKRQVGIKPGKPFVPFDQIDFVLGALVFISIIYAPKWYVWISVLIISFILHFLTNHIAYWTGIRDEKW